MKKHIFKSISLTLVLSILLSNIPALGMQNQTKDIVLYQEPINFSKLFTRVDFTDKVPDEVIRYKILPYLNAEDLVKNVKNTNKKLHDLVKDFVIIVKEQDLVNTGTIKNMAKYFLEDESFLVKRNKIRALITKIENRIKKEKNIPLALNFENQKRFYNSKNFEETRKFIFKFLRKNINSKLSSCNKNLHIPFNLAFFEQKPYYNERTDDYKEITIFTTATLLKEAYQYKYYGKTNKKPFIETGKKYIKKYIEHLFWSILLITVETILEDINPYLSKITLPGLFHVIIMLIYIGNKLSTLYPIAKHIVNLTNSTLKLLNIYRAIKSKKITSYDHTQSILLNGTYDYMGLNKEKLLKKMDKELGILLRAIYPNKNFSQEDFQDLGII